GVMEPYVLSLVERGWRIARQQEIAQPTLRVVHLVKGRLSPSLQRLIRCQKPAQLISYPRNLFWLFAWIWLVLLGLQGRLCAVWVDSDKALQWVSPWCRRCGINAVSAYL